MIHVQEVRVACAGTQPTLPPTDCELASYAQSLGLVHLAAWCALERSTLIGAPVSTGIALTHQLVLQLEKIGLLQMPLLSAERLVRRSLYEPLAWRYVIDWGEPTRLQSMLQTVLVDLSARSDITGAKLELWKALAAAEIQTYLSHLLRRHTLDPSGAAHIVHLMEEEWAKHSLARKRYLAWYGARGAAAALLRTGMDQEAARVAMLEEMRRRSRWLLAKSATNELPKEDYCFMPNAQWKRPALLEIFLTIVLPVGQAYWTELPHEHLSCLTPSAGALP